MGIKLNPATGREEWYSDDGYPQDLAHRVPGSYRSDADRYLQDSQETQRKALEVRPATPPPMIFQPPPSTGGGQEGGGGTSSGSGAAAGLLILLVIAAIVAFSNSGKSRDPARLEAEKAAQVAREAEARKAEEMKREQIKLLEGQIAQLENLLMQKFEEAKLIGHLNGTDDAAIRNRQRITDLNVEANAIVSQIINAMYKVPAPTENWSTDKPAALNSVAGLQSKLLWLPEQSFDPVSKRYWSDPRSPSDRKRDYYERLLAVRKRMAK